ncbi:Fe-S oxidoreductase [Candidatus Scalindua japonica]|uniref:Fe-S oxidoreductase n=1 Tax=Candidatus Scalindua japonica TaxID=1284222 RepID=A0A286TWK1_9BACT|nr:radical SAM protein [Candidatus Scalindua japonica]GAX60252.1 Fe-S oxidoreductase [Candidatus Scalindua japonica]
MKIELISPAAETCAWVLRNFEELGKLVGNEIFMVYPIALPTIAALTPSDIEVTIIDENILPINFDKQVDLVGITTLTYTAKRAYEIADKFRQKGVKVVLGGIHPTMLADEALEHADSIIIGEAENVWPEFIEDFKNNRLKNIYQSTNKTKLDEQDIPRHDLLHSGRYLMNSVNTTRGCPNNCEFCLVHTFFGKGMQHKPVSKVIEEIKRFPKWFLLGKYFFLKIEKGIFFSDDNICANNRYAKELFSALVNLKIMWWSQAQLNIANDNELLNLMDRCGCYAILIGFESLKSENLKIMNKKVNKISEYKKSIDKIHSHGIYILPSFILGNDADDVEDFKKLVDFINKNNFFATTLSILTPFPGTILYKRMEKEGRILDRDWNNYNFQRVVFKPQNMTPEELQNAYYWVLQQIHAYPAIYKRLTALWNTGHFKKYAGKIPFYLRILSFLYITKYLWTKDLSQIKFILKIMLIAYKRSTDVLAVLLGINYHYYVYSLPKGIDPVVYRNKLNHEEKNKENYL